MSVRCCPKCNGKNASERHQCWHCGASLTALPGARHLNEESTPARTREFSIAAPTHSELVYAGFWIRVGATLIDGIILTILTLPALYGIYGENYWESEAIIQGPADFLITWIIPGVAIVLFWIYKQATPGKMAVSARIVDAQTGLEASNAQYIGRYFGYAVAAIPLGLGIIWVAFDRRKQGWHDKIAGTIVVRAFELPRFERSGAGSAMLAPSELGHSERSHDTLEGIETEIKKLEEQANPLDHDASAERARRLAYLKQQRARYFGVS